MPMYRRDKAEQNQHGQTLFYSVWMGGPSLAAIQNCMCEDGRGRTVNITGEADTFFSIPASTRICGRYVSGWVGVDDGRWFFRANKK